MASGERALRSPAERGVRYASGAFQMRERSAASSGRSRRSVHVAVPPSAPPPRSAGRVPGRLSERGRAREDGSHEATSPTPRTASSGSAGGETSISPTIANGLVAKSAGGGVGPVAGG